ncbi:MAG: hypothetical protein WA323_14275, partial [Candidatus Nitrosopolaris sp.]
WLKIRKEEQDEPGTTRESGACDRLIFCFTLRSFLSIAENDFKELKSGQQELRILSLDLR